jgi:hypothetical protein
MNSMEAKDAHRPDEHLCWEYINACRITKGLEPYDPPLQEKKPVERAPTPMPEEAEQEIWSSESHAWNPRSVTPEEEPDVEGKRA